MKKLCKECKKEFETAYPDDDFCKEYPEDEYGSTTFSCLENYSEKH